MKLLRNMRIYPKLLLFAFLMIAIMAIIGWRGSTSVHDIRKATDKIVSQCLIGLTHLEEIKTYYLRHQNDLLYYILSADDNACLRMEGYQTGLKEQLIVYELGTKDLPNQEILVALQTSLTKYHQAAKEVINLVKNGQKADALNLYITKITSIDNGIRNQFQNLSGISEMTAKVAKTGVDIEYKAVTTQLMVIGLFGALLTIVCASFFAGTITKPIKKLVGIIKRLAVGDFATEIKVEGSDEIGLIIAELVKMKESLSYLIHRIHESATAVSHDAKKLASGNQDLSHRTQEQASSLEEIASTLEEINSSIHQMVSNSEHINGLSQETLGIVKDGEVSINESKEAMDRILTSSKKIAEITKAVNQIASQTNLLALNASVEAARSGENGRGFAVVATEIRNLANRSAAMAKEIEKLIKESGDLIIHGNAMVYQSAQILDQIVSNTKKTATEILVMSGSIQEEADALQQIEASVEQLNQVTQENAGMVVSITSSSQSLSSISENLKDLLGEFKTGDIGREENKIAQAEASVVEAALINHRDTEAQRDIF